MFDTKLLELLAERDRLEAQVAEAVAEFDVDGNWAESGSVSTMGWLTSFGRLAPDDARRLLTLGSRCRQLPVVSAAFANATLSAAQVRQITASLSDATVALFAEHEADMVPTLVALTPRQVGFVMARWQCHARAQLDLDRHDDIPDRAMHLSSLPGGRWRLDGDLDAEAGGILQTALGRAMTRDVDGEPQRSPAHRRADALVDIGRFYLDHHEGDRAPRPRAHLDVVITLDALLNHYGGELLDGTPLDAATVARLACDADVHRVIMDRSSSVLDYGRRARLAPNSLREALNVRDRTCRFPGCDRPPAWCEAHHIIDWPRGGHTKPNNMVLLCSRHHHLFHVGGWTHTLRPDNTFEVTTPTGRKLHSRPPPPPESRRATRRSNGGRSSVVRRD